MFVLFYLPWLPVLRAKARRVTDSPYAATVPKIAGEFANLYEVGEHRCAYLFAPR